MPSFILPMHHEVARKRFITEFVERKVGTVGLELGVSGVLDARRRFALAIQGWEHNTWIRPFLIRLEGHFEPAYDHEHTRVVFVKRGLTVPITFLSLLIPYSVIQYLLPRWEKYPITSSDIVLLLFSIALVFVIGGIFYAIERRTHQLLIRALLLIYDNPSLSDEN
ncbi:MAG: hypothetical protein CUN55_10275 [Phototrophicales bacterium]|nr:MAG: hypothetical protein CUN55_10275 [Phototrophicales bacterium]